jgi:hypothetical protein
MFYRKNRVKCKVCDDIVISDSSEEYTTCSCGSVKIRGGPYFLERIGDERDWVEMSVIDIPEQLKVNGEPTSLPPPPMF